MFVVVTVDGAVGSMLLGFVGCRGFWDGDEPLSAMFLNFSDEFGFWVLLVSG